MFQRDAFEQHFEQLIRAHERESKLELKSEKSDEFKRRNNDYHRENTEESLNMKSTQNAELEKQVRELEEADKLVKKITGADDINEICQKYSNLRETKDKLKQEKKDLEKLCDDLIKKKDDLFAELNILKYHGQDEVSRKEIDDSEKEAEKALKACDESLQKLKKNEQLLVDVKAGIDLVVSLLNQKIVIFFKYSMKKYLMMKETLRITKEIY